jgi:hypothetical protein
MEVGQVYTFKLNSGEELIAKIVEITRDNLIIEEPVSVAPSQKGIGLVPSMFTGEPGAKVTLNTNSVAFYTTTEDSVKMKYIEATTGIQLPEKKLILG